MSSARDSRRCLLAIDAIPPCPPGDDQTLRLVHDRDVPLERLAAAIELNPTLTAAVIGLANSAFYAAPQPVHSVRAAIVQVLGLNVVRSLVQSLLLTSTLDVRACTRFSLTRYWARALGVARGAERLCRQARIAGLDPDAAYLGGLLHGIGLLLMASVLPRETSMAITLAELGRGRTGALREAERELTGIDHAEAGELLARRWSLPEPVGTIALRLSQPGWRGPWDGMVALIRDVVTMVEQADAPHPTCPVAAGPHATLSGIGAEPRQHAFAQIVAQRDEVRRSAEQLARVR